MIRRCYTLYPTILALWIGSWLFPAFVHGIPQKTVVHVGNRAQLFIDRELVYEVRGISFTLHPASKRSDRPLLVADQPFEGNAIYQGGTVFYDADEKIFKMWYPSQASEYFDGIVTHYATSTDGIHWDKSLRGTLRAKNGQPHNVVTHRLLPSVMKDPRDPNPARRYKMVCFDPDRGYLSMVSPDGLHWTDMRPDAFLPISYVDDVVTACWSRSNQRFVTFAKQVMPVLGRRRRTIWTATSPDFDHWSRPQPALVADRRDDFGSRIRAEKVRPLLQFPDNPNVMRTEIYGSGAYAAESCLIAFPWMMTATVNIPNVGNQEGPIEVQLAVSRDLEHWQRPYRMPAIELGKPGSWEGGMLSTHSYAFDHQDEVWMYYWATHYTHAGPNPGGDIHPDTQSDGGIGLATWQKDRFVSADGPSEGGTITTVPIQFAGRRLELNANVKPDGKMVVEILDMSLNRLATWPTSAPLTGDHLRHVVRFGETTDVSSLAGQPVVLRFRLFNAELFSFAFRD
ncbi:MAG: hypothetical protein MK179_15955 [Pirellulaceae bacterium]|nr:hypothetical protein [Pirellulaceae bacterium]